MKPIYPLLGVSRPFDPSCTHVTSPFFSPFVLGALRLTFALYTFVTLLVTLIWDSVRVGIGEAFFSYFTHLSYIGLCAYFFASGTQTLLYALRSRKQSQNYTYPLQYWPRPLQFLHVLLQLTVITFPILVTVVFWALLASPEIFHASYSTWSNISVHILNTALGLSEMLLTNVPPPPWLLLPFGVVLLAGYLAVAYITYADQGFYPYTFLNPQNQHAYLAAYIIGIALGYCILFVIVRYTVVLRIKLVGWRRGGRGREGREEMEEWEEVERPSKEGV